MSEVVTKLQISGKLTYEAVITVVQAARIITFLESGDTSEPDEDSTSFTQRETKTSSSKYKVLSPRDAIEKSGAKLNPEKIVALGAFALQNGGEFFKLEEVKELFQRAREVVPKNFPRDLSKAIAAGWLDEGSSGEYYLTHKMDGIFDGGFVFPSGGSGKSGGRRPVKGKSKPTKPNVFDAIDEFPSIIAGFPSYSKMKTDKDKLLWALAFAKANDIKGLSNKDIGWLTDHLGFGIPTGNITSAFNGAKRAGCANRSTLDGTIRITTEGEQYLSGIGSENN